MTSVAEVLVLVHVDPFKFKQYMWSSAQYCSLSVAPAVSHELLFWS